ncbi:hypothetical protein HNO88_003723 [Novosphingobium chloroacetimidivorans]|uniref:Uncharacterized protein n=2 Tax=Novosphingobium chloroacetimidivorans TaxID=1428314 RepID=A0A7W7KCN2_9SPHN|nr:hypothetical protein [Novosphingobium chloroacetimidivorans]
MGYADFAGEFVIPAGVVAARPWLVCDGPNDATDLAVNWRRIRVEDITSERAAKDYADAASTSYTNANIAKGQAEGFASAASGSANTAGLRAGDAATSASAASGSAATATAKASEAATSATLSARYANGSSNRVTSDFAAGKSGWNIAGNAIHRQQWNANNADFQFANENYFGILGLDKNGDHYTDVYSSWAACNGGEWWQASAWLASRECVTFVYLQYADANATYLSDSNQSPSMYNNPRGWSNLENFSRVFVKQQTPANARYVRLVWRKGGWINNGTPDLSWAFMMRPMLAPATADQTDPSPYVPRGGGDGLKDASARIEEVSTVAATANTAVAQIKSTLQVDVNGASARLNTVEQVAAVAFDRTTGARWSKEAISPAGRAQLTVYSLDQNGTPQAGVDIIGDLSVRGDIFVDGTVYTSKIAPNAATQVWYTSRSDVIQYPTGIISTLSTGFAKYAGSESVVQYDVQVPLFGTDAVKINAWLDVWQGGTLIQNRGIRMEVDGNNETYLPFVYQHCFFNLPAGNYEARFSIERTSGHNCSTNGLYHMIVREFKR